MELLETFKELHFQSMFWLLMLPSAMMAIDVITGLMGAWIRKDFQSTKMRGGLAKKAGELLVILIGILFTYGMGIPQQILSCLSLYIVLMELMSIVENLDQLGVPLPKALKDVVNNVGQSLQNDDYKTLMEKMNKLETLLATQVAEQVEKETRVEEGEHGGSNGNF